MLVETESPSSKRRSLWPRILVGVAAVLAVVGIAAQILVKRAEPNARKRVVEWLEAKFDSEVQLGSLHLDILPRPHVTGRDLKLQWKRRTDIPPMIDIDEFHAGLAWTDLVRPDWHIHLVTLKSFHLNIPPREEQAASEPPKKEKAASGAADSIVVDQVVADRMILRMLPREAGKEPKEFDLYKLRIREAGAGRPMKYETLMKNYKPPGLINSTGEFGPWRQDNPGETPLRGDYTFNDADLGVFKGIAGILSSVGNFEGVLSRINVQGTTETPDFRLTMVGNKVPLKASYQAVVDGTNGTTILQPVNAVLGQTPLTVSGEIVGEKGVKGKEIELKAIIRNGRFQDLLQLAVRGGTPMTGLVSLNTVIGIPRGDVDVIQKLNLTGNVDVQGMRFVNPEIQNRIDEVSRRGQGRPGDTAIDEVASKLVTQFSLNNAVLNLPSISYRISGAAADAQGQFNMRSQEMDFDGVVRLNAKASETVEGWKSFFLKPLDPLFSRNGKGTVLYFHVGGTPAAPKFGLDVKRTLKKD